MHLGPSGYFIGWTDLGAILCSLNLSFYPGFSEFIYYIDKYKHYTVDTLFEVLLRPKWFGFDEDGLYSNSPLWV